MISEKYLSQLGIYQGITTTPDFFFLLTGGSCYKKSRIFLPEPQNLLAEKVCQKYFTKCFHGNTSNIFLSIYLLLNVGQEQVFFVFAKYILGSELFV